MSRGTDTRSRAVNEARATVERPSPSEPPTPPGRAPSRGRPLLRGKLHEVAFWMSLVVAPLLAAYAPSGAGRIATGVYALTLSGMLGVSALYHRVTWPPAQRAVLRRLDHAMIFLLIAGTYTPIALVLPPERGLAVLVVVWVGALAGVGFQLAWPGAPRALQAIVYIALGWTAVAVLPDLARALGGPGLALIVGGGVLYSIGAVVYARRRPDPAPAVFGYHEVFHAFVVAAALCHLAAVAATALPQL